MSSPIAAAPPTSSIDPGSGTGVKVMNFGRNSATLLSTGDLPYINQTEYTSATTFVSNAGASAVVDVIIMLGTNDSKAYNSMPTASGWWLMSQRPQSDPFAEASRSCSPSLSRPAASSPGMHPRNDEEDTPVFSFG
jgi:hypothetical protein